MSAKLAKGADGQLVALARILDDLQTLGIDANDAIASAQRHRKLRLLIPLAIFQNRSVGPLEALVFYLRTEHKLTYAVIAQSLHRDTPVMGVVFRNARKKLKVRTLPSPFTYPVPDQRHSVPTSVFADDDCTIFERIAIYAHDTLGLSFNEIALRMGRDERTIWCVYHNAQKKIAKIPKISRSGRGDDA